MNIKYVPVTDESLIKIVSNKANKRGYSYLQNDLMQFHNDSNIKIIKVDIENSHYRDITSAQSSYSHCIKRLGLRMKACTYNKELYIVKFDA